MLPAPSRPEHPLLAVVARSLRLLAHADRTAERTVETSRRLRESARDRLVPLPRRAFDEL